MGYLRAKDTVNGALGTCFAIIDGKRHELMQVKNIQAKVKKTRMTIPILGMTAKQQKSGGWEGTGTMTVYYVSSLFRRVMADYMKNGVDTYFELLLTNEDPTGDAGRQTVLLKDVNIASTTALQALADDGRERGLLAGANVIMPNVTDLSYRRRYQLYADKPNLDENSEESRDDLTRRIHSIGEEILWDQHGDSRHYFNRKEKDLKS